MGISVDGVWGLWSGALWVLWGWGSRDKQRRISLGKNVAWLITKMVVIQQLDHLDIRDQDSSLRSLSTVIAAQFVN